MSAAITPREKEVMVHIASELSTKEIASLMGLSTRTVEDHRQNLYKKLNKRCKVGVARYAIAHGIVSLAGEGK